MASSPINATEPPQLDGDGKRASQPRASGAIAQTTQPQDATRELNTANGRLPYSAVAERLAVNIGANALNYEMETADLNIRQFCHRDQISNIFA
jgi:hypothetical protein